MVDKEKTLKSLRHFFKVTGTASVDDQNKVSVAGSIELKNRYVELLPVQFLEVTGDFLCVHNTLTSLKGAPVEVGGKTSFWNNRLTSLEFCPQKLNGGFNCGANRLSNLLGVPQTVKQLACEQNPLESLTGLPPVLDKLELDYSPHLPLLRVLGAKTVLWSIPYPPRDLEEIIDRYAGQGQSGAIACAAELAEAGFKANARW